MEIPGKLIIVGALGCAIAGAAIDHQFNAREVIKTQVVSNDVIKYKVITQTHTVTNLDGTKTTDSTITDNTEEQKKATSTITDTKAADAPQWLIAQSVGINTETRVRTYALSVDRKILGPISLGAYGSTNKDIGLRLGVAF